MPKFATVDGYLASLPAEQREVMAEIDRRLLLVVPGADRVLRYDMPTWQVEGVSLVHVAAWKKHVSLYPVPPAGDSDLDADLAPYAGAKGTLKLPYRQLDYALVERVVRRLIETRSSKWRPPPVGATPGPDLALSGPTVWHGVGVQTQESRDAKSVAIAAGLGLFCLVLAAGALALWAASGSLDMSEATLRAFSWAIPAVAGLVFVWHVRRSARP